MPAVNRNHGVVRDLDFGHRCVPHFFVGIGQEILSERLYLLLDFSGQIKVGFLIVDRSAHLRVFLRVGKCLPVLTFVESGFLSGSKSVKNRHADFTFFQISF